MRNAVLSVLLLAFVKSNAFAQSSATVTTITTYAGPTLPLDGGQATVQAIDSPYCAVPDGSGGFYIAVAAENRVFRVTADGTLNVFAGNGSPGFSGDGGLAVSAQLNRPQGVATDRSGNVLIADFNNDRIRKVTPDGIITSVPDTGGRVGGPFVVLDTTGNLYITDSNVVFKVTTTGVKTTASGPERLNSPSGAAVDLTGNLFVADTLNHRILKVTPAAVVTTVAGTGTAGFGGDGGSATSAQLNRPSSVAVDAAGNLFIADTYNHRIRRVTPNGGISTFAGGTPGFGGDGGAATAAQLNFPAWVSLDATGNLFVADTSNNRIRKITTGGLISTVAGNGSFGFRGDGGAPTSALLNGPYAVEVDRAGNVLVADVGNNRIRRISSTGALISTVAGNGSDGFGGDGGAALSARFSTPAGIAAADSGEVFISDFNNRRVRKITAAGIVSTVAGTGTSGSAGDGGPAASAQLVNPYGVALDRAGNLFISDFNGHRVRKVTPAGVISTVAGNGVRGFGGDGGPAESAQLDGPAGIAIDAADNLLIADLGNQRVRKVTAAGQISTLAGNGTSGARDNGDGGPAASASLDGPNDLALDSTGNLFVAEKNGHRIRRVTTAGIITTVAGTEGFGFSGDGSPATSGQLDTPVGIAADAAGNLYIADYGNHRIRKVTIAQQVSFSIVDRGGTSLLSSGTSEGTAVGFATLQPNTTSTAPTGLAVFGFRQNNVLVTEASVAATPLIQSGRIYAEVNATVNTGIALANPSSRPASVSFFFTSASGNTFGNGTTTIPALGQIAVFLDQAPFSSGPSVSGSFTFNASVPISAVALRGLTNERGDFLITTLPISDLGAPPQGDVVFPHFADGGGWTTQLVLVNPTDGTLTGTVQLLDPSGLPIAVSINGRSDTTFTYSIPGRSSQKLQTSGSGSTTLSGSVRVVSAVNSSAPSGVAIFSYRFAGITVTEAGVPASAAGTTIRLYAEVVGQLDPKNPGSIQTGIALTNLSTSAATVVLELTNLDGTTTGLTGIIELPANGQTATFLNQISGFSLVKRPFQGVLRILSPVKVSVVGLRARYNERGDLLITTTDAVDEGSAPTTSTLYFPHIVDSAGYSTQFLLFSGRADQASSGTLTFYSRSGGPFTVAVP